MSNARKCKRCKIYLTKKNWPRCFIVRKHGKGSASREYICRNCANYLRQSYYKRNREKMLLWQRAHRKRTRESVLLRQRKYYRKLREKAIDSYGGKCACCGELAPEFLAIDHINGAGKIYSPSGHRLSGSAIYIWLQANGYPKGFLRLLCHNCNSSLANYKYCPHQSGTKGG